jgi:hypothetical protein
MMVVFPMLHKNRLFLSYEWHFTTKINLRRYSGGRIGLMHAKLQVQPGLGRTVSEGIASAQF